MSQAAPGESLSRQVPPRLSAFSRTVTSRTPARFSRMAMPIPPKPAPTMTTLSGRGMGASHPASNQNAVLAGRGQEARVRVCAWRSRSGAGGADDHLGERQNAEYDGG